MSKKEGMFGKLKATIAGLSMLLGFKSEADIPIDAEEQSLSLTDDQMAKLKAHFGDDQATKMLSAINGEIKAHLAGNMNLKAIQDELAALVAEKKQITEELEEARENGAEEASLVEQVKNLKAAHGAEVTKRKELEAQVKLLMESPEGDVPTAIIKNFKRDMKHSDTHLFATGKQYDAFEDRPWNARLRDRSVKATNFNTDSSIPTLQGDLEHFVRENPTVLNSLFNDFEDLPAEWDRRTGVLDQVADGFVIPGEIAQGRKDGWQPKNNFKFVAEVGKVYAKKIDITFNGQQLQKIETTWVAQTQKMDGSHPWKMSFIGFLLAELVKQQKVDDRKAQINGIFAENPDPTVAGANVNSQNGLRFLWYWYRDIKKQYRPFSIGAPTTANIVDYIEKMISLIPEDERDQEGMEIQISQTWLKAYRKRAGEQYQHHYSVDQGTMEYKENYPIDRPNYIFQPLKDQTKTDFIGITKSKNVQVMDYDASEKGKFTVTHEKRDTHIFADYRIGIRFIFAGLKTEVGDPKEFEKQALWSNDVPVFGSEIKVPVFDDTTGILKVAYPHMVIDKNFTHDITSIDGDFVPGQIITITGNTALAGEKKLKDNAVFDIVGDYSLNTAGTITLYVNDDKTLKEIERTTVAPTVTTDINFATATVDANEGSVFRFTGAVDTAMTGIINGVEGRSIRIYGTDAAGIEVTFSTTGNIKMASNASLGTATDYIQLTLVAGFWRETKRVITP